MTTKKCTRCLNIKEEKEFYKRKKRNGEIVPACACKECERERGRKRILTKEQLARNNSCQKEYQRSARIDAIRHYSGGSMACACCGEARIEFLAIDHVHGGGNRHRREKGVSYLATWLKSRGFPAGFQILCHNCNFAKSAYGHCPHAHDRQSYYGATVSGFRDIGPGVLLGIGTRVWAFTVIERDVSIGMECVIGTHCFIGAGSKIGNNVRIQTGVFIPRGSIIEDDVFIGPRVTFTDDRYPRAGNSNYLAEPPVVRSKASIGAGAVILPGVTIGARAMVAAGAVVTSDVEEAMLAIGCPARPRQTKHIMQ